MEQLLKNFDLQLFDVPMIVIGALLFAVLVQALRRVLFAPYLRLFEAREQATIGADAAAQRNNDEAELIERDYQLQLAEERAIAGKNRTQAVNQAKSEAGRIIEGAQHEAHEFTKQAREELERHVQGLRKAASEDASRLSRVMVEKARSAARGGSGQGMEQ